MAGNLYNSNLNEKLKSSLRKSLVKLMENEDFEKITISELCNDANVSRQGFYRNYSSTKDIIDEMSEDFFEEITKIDFNFYTDKAIDSYEWFRNYFKILIENEDIIKSLLKAGFQAENLNRTNEMILNLENNFDSESKAKAIIFNGALHNISIYYLKNKDRFSIDEISLWCSKYILK